MIGPSQQASDLQANDLLTDLEIALRNFYQVSGRDRYGLGERIFPPDIVSGMSDQNNPDLLARYVNPPAIATAE